MAPQPVIQRFSADPRDSLKAFAQTLNARERGEIFLEEISPMLAKGQGIIGLNAMRPKNGAPLEAANSFGTLVGNLISQRVLELLHFNLPSLNRISTDFSDEQVKFNQPIFSRYVTIPTVGTYDPSTGYPAATTVAANDVQITINQHKCVELDLNVEQVGGTARNLFEEQVPAMAYALGLDLINYVYSLIVAGTFTNAAVVQASTGFGRPTVINLAKALTAQGVPIGSQFRTLLLNSVYFGQLQNDSSIVSLGAFQDPDLIQEYQLPPVSGFQVIEAPNLPATGNMAGFAFSKSALVAATRLPLDYNSILPGASFGQVRPITDAATGASMMTAGYVNHTLGTVNFRLAWMYGAAAGQAKAGNLLTSA